MKPAARAGNDLPAIGNSVQSTRARKIMATLHADSFLFCFHLLLLATLTASSETKIAVFFFISFSILARERLVLVFDC